LTPKQLFAARALAGGRTSTQVADSLSTTQQTVNRWRRDPQFAREVQRLHDVILREAVRRSSPPAQRPPQKVPPPKPSVARAIVPRQPPVREATDEEMAAWEREYKEELIRKHGKDAVKTVRIVNGKMTFHDLD
jgi:hypothetical protein